MNYVVCDQIAGTIGVTFQLPDGQNPEAARVQLQALADAFLIYLERNEHYRDNWRRMGWRGLLIRIRERSERLWDAMWDWEDHDSYPSVDDARDLINFAAFLIRAINGVETTRDGSWW